MAPDSHGRLGPEAIARTTFQTTFRGYDQEHVRAFLDEVAAEMRDARDREAALRQQIESLESRVAAGDQLDEARLTAALGEETARVLTAAREAAVEIRSKAEESAARVMKDAHDEASRLRGEAEGILAKRTEIAEKEVASIWARTEEAAAAVVATAHSEAERITDEATAAAEGELEAARATGRQMVQEAQAVRERVLKDLARKRKTARAQLEQLRAGRERLVQAYDVVRRTLDEATGELNVALTEAKLSADAAMRRVEAEPEPDLEELEAEVENAKLAGLATVAAEPEVAPEHAPEADEPAEPAEADDEGLPPLPEEIPPAPQQLGPVVPPRAKGKRRGGFDLPPVEYTPLTPRDPVEGMRVITGETPVVAIPAEVAEDARAEPAVTDSAELAEASTHEAAAEPEVDVDDLFARIKAARAETVAKAEEVLAEPAPEPDTEPASEPAADAEPEVAVVVEEVVVETDDGEEVAVAVVVVENSPPEPDDQALLERRDGLLEPIEARLTKALKRAMADEQNDVLDKLRRSKGKDLDAVLPVAVAQLERYAEPLKAELAVAADAGASFAGEERSGPNVDAVAADLASSIVTPMRERITTALHDANGDEEAGADGVRACYREWKSQRLGALVNDAALTAFNRGVFDTVEGGTPLRWLVDNGGSPCPDAEDNALAGLVPCGEPFPTGHGHPPAHPGCRCMIVPTPAVD